MFVIYTILDYFYTAGAVNGVTSPAQIEIVADAAGNRVGQTSRQRLITDYRERPLVSDFKFGQEFSPFPGIQPSLISLALTILPT